MGGGLFMEAAWNEGGIYGPHVYRPVQSLQDLIVIMEIAILTAVS